MFPSNLKPDSSVAVGIASAAAVYGIYSLTLPNAADVAASDPHNSDVETARKTAAWESIALLSVVFLVSKDLNAYIIGGVGLIGVDYAFKHMNGINPSTGKLDASTSGQTIAPGLATAYPVSDYNDDSEAA